MIRIWLVCFDISSNRRRRKVADILLTYGNRVQKSVFEVTTRRDWEIQELKNKLEPLVESDDDLRFYYLPKDALARSENVKGEPLGTYPAAIIL